MDIVFHAAPSGARKPFARLRAAWALIAHGFSAGRDNPPSGDLAKLGDRELRDIGLDGPAASPDWSRPWASRPWAS